MAKLPLPPDPEKLHERHTPAWTTGPAVLWRVRFTRSAYPLAWDEPRSFGPLAAARFDPHEPPPREQRELVGYFAQDWSTCLAEVFQVDRVVHPRRHVPFITGIVPTRDLQLLDLTGAWPLEIGASHHVNTGRKDHCRAWARALRKAWPEADGLASVGITSGRVVTLFRPAADVLGERPAYDRPLADAAHEDRLGDAVERIGYDFV